MDKPGEPPVHRPSGHQPSPRDPGVPRLPGPKAWSAILAVESARCRRYGRSGTVVMVEVSGPEDPARTRRVDVDPRAEAGVGGVLRAKVRASDHAARVGPGRFGIILPETDEVAAVNIVERVRVACDEALRAIRPDARTWFGWADATPTRSLAEAADIAIERIAADRRTERAG